jgi:hypothetical protein
MGSVRTAGHQGQIHDMTNQFPLLIASTQLICLPVGRHELGMIMK